MVVYPYGLFPVLEWVVKPLPPPWLDTVQLNGSKGI